MGGRLQWPAAPASCATPRRWRAPRSWRSTWRRCSTGSCSTSSSCSTGCCTSPASRSTDGAAPSACRLEKWRTEAIEAGARALDQLRDGVADAIAALGTGFLRHPANGQAPRRPGRGPVQAGPAAAGVPAAVLVRRRGPRRTAARPDARPDGTDRGTRKYFSARRLRQPRCAGSAPRTATYGRSVQLVLNGLGDENGLPQLGLPGLGGIYDDTGTDQMLRGLELSNEYLLAAVKSLARVYDKSAKRYRPVDYLHLGAEELGSIYESLLELVPKWSHGDREFLLRNAMAGQRAEEHRLLLHADLAHRLPAGLRARPGPRRRAEARRSGSDRRGHRRRRTPSPTPCWRSRSATRPAAPGTSWSRRPGASPSAWPPSASTTRSPPSRHCAHALRDVVTHCVYGVDVNPMAVELAKVSLWLEALEPGKPLGFLDAHIKQRQRPDRRHPRADRPGHPRRGVQAHRGRRPEVGLRQLGRANANDRPDPGRTLQRPLHLLAVQRGTSRTQLGPDRGHTRRLPARRARAGRRVPRRGRNPRRTSTPTRSPTPGAPRSSGTRPRTRPARYRQPGLPAPARAGQRWRFPRPRPRRSSRLKAEYGFFHWHLEFPDIFHVSDDDQISVDPATGWSGGFTCVLGNPPWDKVDFEDKKYFSAVEPSIAALAGQKRRARIIEWEQGTPGRGRIATGPRGARSRPRSVRQQFRRVSRGALRG